MSCVKWSHHCGKKSNGIFIAVITQVYCIGIGHRTLHGRWIFLCVDTTKDSLCIYWPSLPQHIRYRHLPGIRDGPEQGMSMAIHGMVINFMLVLIWADHCSLPTTPLWVLTPGISRISMPTILIRTIIIHWSIVRGVPPIPSTMKGIVQIAGAWLRAMIILDTWRMHPVGEPIMVLFSQRLLCHPGHTHHRKVG